jgi:hypothetical protein
MNGTNAVLKTLKVEAIDNHGYHYAVTLRDGGYTPVVSVEKTPGKWYLTTLMGHAGDSLSIDYGQNWYVTNFGAIRDEISKTFV